MQRWLYHSFKVNSNLVWNSDEQKVREKSFCWVQRSQNRRNRCVTKVLIFSESRRRSVRKLFWKFAASWDTSATEYTKWKQRWETKVKQKTKLSRKFLFLIRNDQSFICGAEIRSIRFKTNLRNTCLKTSLTNEKTFFVCHKLPTYPKYMSCYKFHLWYW